MFLALQCPVGQNARTVLPYIANCTSCTASAGDGTC